MKQKWFIMRYYLSTILIHVGLNVMPDSAYKRELLRRMWELRADVEVALYNEENKDGKE